VVEKQSQVYRNHCHPGHYHKGYRVVMVIMPKPPELFQIMKDLILDVPAPMQNFPKYFSRHGGFIGGSNQVGNYRVI